MSNILPDFDVPACSEPMLQNFVEFVDAFCDGVINLGSFVHVSDISSYIKIIFWL